MSAPVPDDSPVDASPLLPGAMPPADLPPPGAMPTSGSYAGPGYAPPPQAYAPPAQWDQNGWGQNVPPGVNPHAVAQHPHWEQPAAWGGPSHWPNRAANLPGSDDPSTWPAMGVPPTVGPNVGSWALGSPHATTPAVTVTAEPAFIDPTRPVAPDSV